MSRATNEAYAYLKMLGVHPPRRPREARELARRMRTTQDRYPRCLRCGKSRTPSGKLCEFEAEGQMGGCLALCHACCALAQGCATVEDLTAFLGPLARTG